MLTSRSKIDVRYPDADPMGIVHHAVYPVWYEIARMDFFAEMGFGYADMHALGIDPPMVDLHVTYAAPVRYPGSVTVKTHIRSYAPKKIELQYETYVDGSDSPVSRAETFHIWTGPDGKSFNMEQNLPEVYEKIKKAAE
jgi:acyl-CoA thioester hydrolase